MWHISNLWLFFECQNKSSYKNIMSAFTHGCCCCQQKVVLFFGILLFIVYVHINCFFTIFTHRLLVVNYYIWWPESSVQGGLQQKLTNVENIFSTSQLGRRSANLKYPLAVNAIGSIGYALSNSILLKTDEFLSFPPRNTVLISLQQQCWHYVSDGYQS